MRHICTFLFFMSAISLNAQQVWTSSQESDIPHKNLDQRYIVPEKFDTYKLDMDLLIQKLSKAPMDDHQKSNQKTVSLRIPLPEGKSMDMEFVESPCMSPVLSEKFPNIKSFLGYNPNNRSEVARIDYSPMGFHAAINTNQGIVYIDPYYTFPDEHYMTYYVKDHHVELDANTKTCGYTDYQEVIEDQIEQYASPNEEVINYKSIPVIKTTYRLALACTGAWGSLWGTKENVMSRFNTGVNRLNIIFENEVGTHFEMIDNNDDLIFFRENEPYSAPNLGGETLGENTSVINNAVGSDAYDIGHVFTVRCTDGVAGIAFGGSVCRSDKGGGVSCIGTSDVSFFVMQTGAHEVGHQLSGGHSWNNCPSSDPQRSPNTAWEPGSGSTILSYSGLCGNNNVTGPNDAYFHVGNVNQFYDFIENVSCGNREASANNTPDLFVDIPDGLTIPISTPFELTGSAIDPDGDELTYNWEQMDLGPPSQLGNPMGNSPLFRSLAPNRNNTTRLFPQLGNILSNTGNPREVLPTYNRDLTFRFTVRDNHPGVGCTVWEEVKFRSSDTAGPFRVTSPNGITFQEVGAEYLIEWDVANTDNSIIDCQTVDIFLSTDGGRTFDNILAEDVPNDGSHMINIPNIITNAGRIKVKATNNVFFNIGRGEVVIRAPSTPGFYIDLAESDIDVCLPENASVDVIGTTFQDFENEVTLDIVSGLPDNASFEFTNNPVAPGSETTLNIDLSNVTESSFSEIVIRATAADADTIDQVLNLEVTGTDMSDLSLIAPESGSEGINGTPTFEWAPAANADSYILEISTSPEFGPTNTFISEGIKVLDFIPQVLLENSELYYWRVSAVNKCVTMFESEINTFGTLSLNCLTYSADDLPKNISQSGTSSITSKIQIFEQGEIADVNVDKIKGVHGRARDLTAVLINPAGEEIELFSDRCTGANFNIGLDTESPIDFTCPLNSGRITKLEEGTLFGFNGGEIEGTWELRIEDNDPGEGGRLDEFVLELCSNSTFDQPFIVNNNVLEVLTGSANKIFNDLLLSQDNNNTAQELLYTIVVVPTKGTLYMNGEPMTVGSRFTQADIDSQGIRYVHEGSEDETDRFIFTVIDGEGGFIDLTEFIINTGMDFSSATDELGQDDRFRVFPNPVSNRLHIYNSEVSSGTEWQVQMYNLEGQIVYTDVIDQRLTIDTESINSGLYLLYISDGKTFYTHKVNVIK